MVLPSFTVRDVGSSVEAAEEVKARGHTAWVTELEGHGSARLNTVQARLPHIVSYHHVMFVKCRPSRSGECGRQAERVDSSAHEEGRAIPVSVRHWRHSLTI